MFALWIVLDGNSPAVTCSSTLRPRPMHVLTPFSQPNPALHHSVFSISDAALDYAVAQSYDHMYIPVPLLRLTLSCPIPLFSHCRCGAGLCGVPVIRPHVRRAPAAPLAGTLGGDAAVAHDHLRWVTLLTTWLWGVDSVLALLCEPANLFCNARSHVNVNHLT